MSATRAFKSLATANRSNRIFHAGVGSFSSGDARLTAANASLRFARSTPVAPSSLTRTGAGTGLCIQTSTRAMHSSITACYDYVETDDLPNTLPVDVSSSSLPACLATAHISTDTLLLLAKAMPKLIFGTNSTPLIPLQINTTPSNLRALAFILKTSTFTQASMLIDIVVQDRPQLPGRFSIKYLLLSIPYNQRFIIEVFARETTILPSLAAPFAHAAKVFSSSNWLEREAYDMFGLYFSEHGDLRRILTDYGFTGHPLRKDFPLTGFTEIFYDDAEGRIVTEPVELTQEFRVFHL